MAPPQISNFKGKKLQGPSYCAQQKARKLNRKTTPCGSQNDLTLGLSMNLEEG
eukprot:CAMPEP_0194497010 /NCGR_PEP_ID=MMETSP0253-20130528/14097_1 /TAXON_ID=2966 /ORGANISM="Noctiluca scintillans" /LENGTH=52 /DNA_ID=CAMNT_0039338473 /DNA_START=9 /DNA_END=164 /DNA_ORIENTATION=-